MAKKTANSLGEWREEYDGSVWRWSEIDGAGRIQSSVSYEYGVGAWGVWAEDPDLEIDGGFCDSIDEGKTLCDNVVNALMDTWDEFGFTAGAHKSTAMEKRAELNAYMVSYRKNADDRFGQANIVWADDEKMIDMEFADCEWYDYHIMSSTEIESYLKRGMPERRLGGRNRKHAAAKKISDGRPFMAGLKAGKKYAKKAMKKESASVIKIRDFIKMDIDIDVVDDYCEELYIAFCGPLGLTATGATAWADVLDMDIDITRIGGYDPIAVVLVENSEQKMKRAKDFFESVAGYCSASDWDKWFVFE